MILNYINYINSTSSIFLCGAQITHLYFLFFFRRLSSGLVVFKQLFCFLFLFHKSLFKRFLLGHDDFQRLTLVNVEELAEQEQFLANLQAVFC